MSLTFLSTPQFSFGFDHLWLEVLLVAFVLLVIWRQPAWQLVLFCAGVGGLTLA